MTAHASTLADFSRRLSRVSECLLSGPPLDRAAEMIRGQLDATRVAIQICGRHVGAGTLRVFPGFASARGARALSSEEELLCDLLRTSFSRNAVSTGEDDRCALWVFRARDQGDFGEEAEALCEIFVGQLRRGYEISTRMSDSEAERALYSRVMERLSVGIVTLDAGGRVLRASRGAEATLEARRGLRLQRGRLRASSAREDGELQAAIREAVSAEWDADGTPPPATGLTVTREGHGRGLGLVLQPIGADDGIDPARRARVAVYLRDPDGMPEVEGELVRQLFDLTPAEAAVARRLATGLSLEEAAGALGISRNTARAHLRSIFSKSGIRRQTELVRLMLTSAAMLAPARRRLA